MLLEVLALAVVLEGTALGVLWWYHGRVARGLTSRAEAAESALGIVKSVNTDLRESLDRVVADTVTRNAREAVDDAHTASAAAGSAAAAAALLNGLSHEDRPSPRRPAGPVLPPAAAALVSDAVGDDLP